HQMLEAYQPGSSGKSAPPTGSLQPVGKPLTIEGKTITRVNVVPTATEAAALPQTMVMTPVATPVFISGMGRPALQRLQDTFGRYGLVAMPGPGKVDVPEAAGATRETPLQPGAAVGAQLVDG